MNIMYIITTVIHTLVTSHTMNMVRGLPLYKPLHIKDDGCCVCQMEELGRSNLTATVGHTGYSAEYSYMHTCSIRNILRQCYIELV